MLAVFDLLVPAHCGHTYCGHAYYGHTYRSTTAQVFEFDGSTFSSTYALQACLLWHLCPLTITPLHAQTPSTIYQHTLTPPRPP